MNIVVLHGDNVAESRARLDKFVEAAKKRGWDIRWVDSQTTETLPEVLSGTNLFQREVLTVLTDINTLKRTHFRWLNEKGKDLKVNLVIYSDKFIPAETLRLLPQKTKTEEFKLPKIIFDFLSSLYPGNSVKSLRLLHEVLTHEPPEFVFALLARQFKDLYLIKVSPDSLPYQGWRMAKLKSQSAKFSKEGLEAFIGLLAGIDVAAKTGGPGLIDSLDVTLARQLQ